MGGRIASHVAAQGGAGTLAGVIFFVYPLLVSGAALVVTPAITPLADEDAVTPERTLAL